MFSNMLDCFFPSPALACSVKDGEPGKEKQWFVATRNSRACSVFVFSSSQFAQSLRSYVCNVVMTNGITGMYRHLEHERYHRFGHV